MFGVIFPSNLFDIFTDETYMSFSATQCTVNNSKQVELIVNICYILFILIKIIIKLRYYNK